MEARELVFAPRGKRCGRVVARRDYVLGRSGLFWKTDGEVEIVRAAEDTPARMYM